MKISSGRIKKNILAIIYGPEGGGKSTYCSKFPSPVFITTEEGTNSLDVFRTPMPQTWDELLAQVDYLIETPHEFKTVVLDSLDFADRLLVEKLKGKFDSIQEAHSYGSWVGVLNSHHGALMAKLSKLRNKCHILVIAHSQLRKTTDLIAQEQFDKVELKLFSEKTSALWKEFTDNLLYLHVQKTVVKDKQGRVKVFSDDDRKILTVGTGRLDAKNRLFLPNEISAEPEVLLNLWEETFKDNKGELESLLKEMEAKDPEKYLMAKEFYDEFKSDPNKMTALRNRLRAVL